MNEETQVYFIDNDTLPPEAAERKKRLEQDPSSRIDHMTYLPGMEVIESDIQEKVISHMITINTQQKMLSVRFPTKHVQSRILKRCSPLPQLHSLSAWQEEPNWKRESISETRSTYLHRSI